MGVTLARVTCQGKMASLQDRREQVVAKLAEPCLQFILSATIIQNFFGRYSEQGPHVKQRS